MKKSLILAIKQRFFVFRCSHTSVYVALRYSKITVFCLKLKDFKKSLILGLIFLACLNTAFARKDDPVVIAEVKKFSTAMDDIQKYYVHVVNEKSLFENAIRGMLSGLDPHCAYLDKEDFQDLNETTRGEFAGIGLEVTMEHGFVRVITPIDGTPSQKAGIKPGDYIVKLNKMSVSGLTLRAAVNQMRGPKGSRISLEILRKNSTKPLHFVLKREIIHIQSVKNKMLDNTYGYLKLSLFQSSTPQEMIRAINGLKQQAKKQKGQHLQGVILDLRNNPGGLLNAGIAVADAFINGKKNNSTIIVYTKGRSPKSQFVAHAKPGDIIENVPLVVLINDGSASAAEIVAGALKDNHRALLLGTRSFGKGSVQTVIPISRDSAIKITTALYYTPAGVSIQAKGITPDITVKQIILDAKDFSASNENSDDLTESALQGHLLAAPGQNSSSSMTKTDNELMRHDYQLYQALNVLKGMVLTSSLDGD